MLAIRIAAQYASANADALRGAVAAIRIVGGRAVQLYQHRVIHVHPESTFDSFRISAVTVSCAEGHVFAADLGTTGERNPCLVCGCEIIVPYRGYRGANQR